MSTKQISRIVVLLAIVISCVVLLVKLIQGTAGIVGSLFNLIEKIKTCSLRNRQPPGVPGGCLFCIVFDFPKLTSSQGPSGVHTLPRPERPSAAGRSSG